MNRLKHAYTEAQRAYHNVQHILECLDHFKQVQTHLEDPIAVEMAIWFHDAVYDPKASDNEWRSAELMKQRCQDFMSTERVEKVYQWIIATQKHQPSNDFDLNTLLDIDLAILGSDSQRFSEYEKQIRFEYAWVEPDLYHIKRKQVLAHFYQMNQIYQTEYFRHHYEKQAKLNLKPYV